MKNRVKKVFILLMCATLLASWVSIVGPVKADEPSGSEPEAGTYGSGSYQLNSVGNDYRFYTEYYVTAASNKKITTAGVQRRTSIQVYAREGEVILFGSSVSDSWIDKDNNLTSGETGADIVITKPDETKKAFDVTAPGKTDADGTYRKFGHGYIANPTQEKNGPMINHDEETAASTQSTSDYYVPLSYKVQPGEGGIYTFEFHSKKGKNDGQTVKPVKASSTAWDQKEIAVAAWDVTVLGQDASSNWEVKEGRAWADYLALTTGAAGSTESDLNLHVLTHDGIVYKVDFKKAVPFGFVFFANNTGFETIVKDADGNEMNRVPVYHSFYDSNNDLDNMANENIVLHKPNEEDTDTEETYKIFFNRPSADLDEISIKTSPDASVTISNLRFKENASAAQNIVHAGQGGLFTFHASGEASVTISLDLRKAILDSGITTEEYDGSGIIEVTAFAHEGDNAFYWDGKDTEGVLVPAGVYGDNNVVIASEVKRGEIHFPVIDMEGLHGGLKIERLNGTLSESSKYDLYYNNNPLAYGTIEGNYPKVEDSSKKYNLLTDGTKSYNIASNLGGWNYFKNYLNNITTLKKDDKEYLAQKLFGVSYNSLGEKEKEIIDAEFGIEKDTFHFEPVNSSVTTMQFASDSTYGGGNQAGIDAWTYFSQGISHDTISFAIIDGSDKGMVQGQLFYDANKNSEYDTGASATDYPLSHVKVRLIDKNGQPVTHIESLPCFDDAGHFIYDVDGKVKHENKTVSYDTVTDSHGVYRFTGVPYDLSQGTTYYVQVLLNDTQTEALRYTCTTSDWVKSNLISVIDDTTPFHNNSIGSEYGPDGNKMEPVTDNSKVYGYKNTRNTESGETVFDQNESSNKQSVSFTASTPVNNGVMVETFKKIGYCSAVPEENQWSYTVQKEWDSNTHKISDGLTVELWVWNDSDVTEENTDLGLSRRTGALIDTQVLNEANGWTYTWHNLDNRLQYYVLEYYTKKKANGDIIYNDKREPRMVLIGGTMPIFGAIPDDKQPTIDSDGYYTKGIYGFATNLGNYPEKINYKNSEGNVEKRIPIQYFAENSGAGQTLIHSNSITEQEKLESVDNNARQYKVTYTLSTDTTNQVNTIKINNKQVFDDRTYYVWLNHETELPNMIGKTFVEHDGGTHKLNSHAVALQPDTAQVVNADTGTCRIKGLSISSMDAANAENTEGNSTDIFYIQKNATDVKSALFTATSHGCYTTGTGTRTYRVKYVVDGSDNPVSIKVNSDGQLVLASDETTLVEGNPSYTVYSWYMTIHVYDLEADGIIEYDPEGGSVNLQTALAKGSELTWTLEHDGQNYNSITYTSDDTRDGGILSNDTYRVPLYKSAEDPDMGTCADIIGIAYAGSVVPVDDSQLEYADTYESRYGSASSGELDDGIATAVGKGGEVTVELNTARDSHINRIQDHANYADVTFTPMQSKAKAAPTEDVFFYKVVVLAEDSTYQFKSYDEIDASDGVVMYTNFIMKPTTSSEPPTVDPIDPVDPINPTNPTDDGNNNNNTGENNKPSTDVNGNDHQSHSPKTNDDNRLLEWMFVMIGGFGLLVVFSSKRRKANLEESWLFG